MSSTDSNGRQTLVRVSLAAALLVFVAVSTDLEPLRADWLEARQRLDPMGDQDRLYRALVAWLPETGRVGYIPTDWPSLAAAGQLFRSEYALTPRIVVPDSTPDFLIVDPEPQTQAYQAAATGVGNLPDGFELFAKTDAGLRLFRRVR
jgi:hypothetical protein